MHSRDPDMEVEEVVEEIESSMDTADYLSARMRGEYPERTDKKDYSYFRRGIASLINFCIILYNLKFIREFYRS